jgi:NADH:ubiquinone reductase (H+-translocating)
VAHTRPHVVIIGGGFGGLQAARRLRRAPVRITLIDRRNHHLFQPLLYQVATAALNPGDIAYPIRAALRRQENVRVLLAEARSIDVAGKRVVLDDGELDYDFLIVATGATHSYFGHDDWAKCAPGLKTVEDALEIRKRIYLAYEAAERESDPEKQCEWLTFVVVGAGPTGVELAGSLAEIGLHTLSDDFRSIDPTQVQVLLLEGTDRVLPSYPDDLSAKARAQLERVGVKVHTGAMVTAIDETGVEVGESERISARTVLWAAGVRASRLARTLGVPLDSAGRVLVEDDLSIPGHPEVFVVGDLAAARMNGTEVPGVAQGAIQGGRHAADNIRRALNGQPHARFRYRDKGSLATIGRAAAVADLGRLRFSGFWAWIVWWLVHITFLVGFRNRILVMFTWAWSYVTFQRGARLITGTTPPLPTVHLDTRALPPPGPEPRDPAAAHEGLRESA